MNKYVIVAIAILAGALVDGTISGLVAGFNYAAGGLLAIVLIANTGRSAA